MKFWGRELGLLINLTLWRKVVLLVLSHPSPSCWPLLKCPWSLSPFPSIHRGGRSCQDASPYCSYRPPLSCSPGPRQLHLSTHSVTRHVPLREGSRNRSCCCHFQMCSSVDLNTSFRNKYSFALMPCYMQTFKRLSVSLGYIHGDAVSFWIPYTLYMFIYHFRHVLFTSVAWPGFKRSGFSGLHFSNGRSDKEFETSLLHHSSVQNIVSICLCKSI